MPLELMDPLIFQARVHHHAPRQARQAPPLARQEHQVHREHEDNGPPPRQEQHEVDNPPRQEQHEVDTLLAKSNMRLTIINDMGVIIPDPNTMKSNDMAS